MTRADLTAHPIDFLDGLSPAVKKRVELLEAIQVYFPKSYSYYDYGATKFFFGLNFFYIMLSLIE
jgi:hypothetical protein